MAMHCQQCHCTCWHVFPTFHAMDAIVFKEPCYWIIMLLGVHPFVGRRFGKCGCNDSCGFVNIASLMCHQHLPYLPAPCPQAAPPRKNILQRARARARAHTHTRAHALFVPQPLPPPTHTHQHPTFQSDSGICAVIVCKH